MATVRELTTLLGYKVNEADLKRSEAKLQGFKQRLKMIGLAVVAGITAIGTGRTRHHDPAPRYR